VLCFVTSSDGDDKAAWDSGEVSAGVPLRQALFYVLLLCL